MFTYNLTYRILHKIHINMGYKCVYCCFVVEFFFRLCLLCCSASAYVVVLLRNRNDFRIRFDATERETFRIIPKRTFLPYLQFCLNYLFGVIKLRNIY